MSIATTTFATNKSDREWASGTKKAVQASEVELLELIREKEDVFTEKQKTYDAQFLDLLSSVLSSSPPTTIPSRPVVATTAKQSHIPHHQESHTADLLDSCATVLQTYTTLCASTSASTTPQTDASRPLHEACEADRAKTTRLLDIGRRKVEREIEALVQRRSCAGEDGKGGDGEGMMEEEEEEEEEEEGEEATAIFKRAEAGGGASGGGLGLGETLRFAEKGVRRLVRGVPEGTV
ncbi:hypothetical protein LTR66_013711 [Elasticomyces elasticus]|nr:hypothetical protein LTR28_010745 [Elasticomyces elasticus]KAK4952881.1 hypothetical protein LTR66_013711 [Elasticomyces elasticus]